MEEYLILYDEMMQLSNELSKGNKNFDDKMIIAKYDAYTERIGNIGRLEKMVSIMTAYESARFLGEQCRKGILTAKHKEALRQSLVSLMSNLANFLFVKKGDEEFELKPELTSILLKLAEDYYR